jgi:hypothetical protein
VRRYIVSFERNEWRLGPPGTGKNGGSWVPGIGSGFLGGRPSGCRCQSQPTPFSQRIPAADPEKYGSVQSASKDRFDQHTARRSLNSRAGPITRATVDGSRAVRLASAVSAARVSSARVGCAPTLPLTHELGQRRARFARRGTRSPSSAGDLGEVRQRGWGAGRCASTRAVATHAATT